MDNHAVARRILITDDYPHAAEVLAWLLRRFNYDIRIATDGFQGISIAEEFRPDVILLDIGMPELNGFETAKQIRNKPWSRGMVLIALSGKWDEEYEQLSREAGFDAHLVKPVRAKQIVDLLEKFIGMDR